MPTNQPHPHDEATTQAVALGFHPAGYHDPDTGRLIPWGAPAADHLDLDEEDTEPDEGPVYTVFDYHSDQADAEGTHLGEYFSYRAIDPTRPPHDDDPYDDRDDI